MHERLALRKSYNILTRLGNTRNTDGGNTREKLLQPIPAFRRFRSAMHQFATDQANLTILVSHAIFVPYH